MKPDSDIKDPKRRETEARKDWMGILARTETKRLEKALTDLGLSPHYEYMRPPEVGMAMVRARAEAKGNQFNLGEMTVARCSVRLENGPVGHGYVAGRDTRHAELAAVFDALLQSREPGPGLLDTISAFAAEQNAVRTNRDAKTAATKVNFFTMVRGSD